MCVCLHQSFSCQDRKVGVGQEALTRIPDPLALQRSFSSRTRRIALVSVVPLGGFDRQRGKSSVRFFLGSRRRCIRLPDIASFGYSLGSSPLLRGSTLRSTTKRLTPLLLRE